MGDVPRFPDTGIYLNYVYGGDELCCAVAAEIAAELRW